MRLASLALSCFGFSRAIRVGIVGRQVLRQEQVHRDLHRIADRNLRHVLDAVELHDAVEHVADVFRVDAAGEADRDRRVERLALLQPVNGIGLGGAARRKSATANPARPPLHSRRRNIIIR